MLRRRVSGVLNLCRRIWSSGVAPSLGFGDLGFGVWGLGFGVWGLGFRVWGLGFGGLGFGV